VDPEAFAVTVGPFVVVEEAPEEVALDGIAFGGGALEVGTVRALFGPLVFGPLAGGSRTWDVTPDGQRILALAAPEQEAVAPFTLIQNWTAGLKK
jgi:hypothetical protein